MYLCDMKRFKTISTTFIIVIAIIFGCNVYYLVSLYDSIRANLEKEVMTAMADADIDDMWERADRANRAAASARQAYIENGDSVIESHGSVSGVKDDDGNFVTTATNKEGKTTVNKKPLRRDRSYTNQMVNDMSQQMHQNMDPYVDFNLTIMDSVLLERLADRNIYPDFVAVEVTDSNGNVYRGNIHAPKNASGYDVFSLCFNPQTDMYYKAYMTPLTHHILSQMLGVIAYSANDALLNYDTANDPQKKVTYLNIANRQLKRLGELVENILAMSMERRKTMRLKPVTILLRPFVEEIAAAQRMRTEKEIVINVNMDDDVSVEADRTHLGNVLNNLIDNAIKYSGDSVTITVSNDNGAISVKDNGIGIPSKSIPFLFNKFYRVPHGNRQDVRGYGIGLYYVKSILDKMGWDIEVRSKEGEGSTFTIKYGRNEK